MLGAPGQLVWGGCGGCGGCCREGEARAGGLGDLIFNGLNLFQPDLIIGGTIPVTILALVIDWLLGRLEYHLTPVSERT